MTETELPIFRRIIESINAGIESGAYARGAAIPSEPELSRTFGTTRMTVRRAIDALVNEGKLYRIQGKGTFVSHIEREKTYRMQGFTSNMLSLGLRPSSRVLSAGVCTPEAEIARELELETGERVLCLRRVRLADQEPIALEQIWISLRRYPKLEGLDYAEISLYEVLRREYDLEPAYSRQRLNAIWAKGEDAKILFGANKGVALRMRSVDYDRNMRPIAAADALYHGAKYTFDAIIK